MLYPIPVGSGALHAVWEPEMPGRLNDAELRQYRAGRDALVAAVAAQTGLNIAVIE